MKEHAREMMAILSLTVASCAAGNLAVGSAMESNKESSRLTMPVGYLREEDEPINFEFDTNGEPYGPPDVDSEIMIACEREYTVRRYYRRSGVHPGNRTRGDVGNYCYQRLH
jgi:hypothetical protein